MRLGAVGVPASCLPGVAPKGPSHHPPQRHLRWRQPSGTCYHLRHAQLLLGSVDLVWFHPGCRIAASSPSMAPSICSSGRVAREASCTGTSTPGVVTWLRMAAKPSLLKSVDKSSEAYGARKKDTLMWRKPDVACQQALESFLQLMQMVQPCQPHAHLSGSPFSVLLGVYYDVIKIC